VKGRTGTVRGLALRGRLVLLFLIALLPALTTAVITTVEHRQSLRDEAENTTKRLAGLAAAHVEGLFASSYQTLRVLDEDPLVLAAGRTCESRFEHVLASADHSFTALALLDPSGNLICSIPRAARSVARGHPLLARLHAGEDFVVGEAELGPITGKPVIVIVQSIREREKLVALVAAGLDLASLGDLADRSQLPEGAILAILTGDGTLLARYPKPAQYIGADARDLPGCQTATQNAREPGVVRATTHDGTPHVFGFAPLTFGGGRFCILVGLNERHLMEPADHVLGDNIKGFGLAAVVAFVLAATAGEFFLRRPIERMRLTAEGIAAGDLTARVAPGSAPGELGGLARAIDEMADGLQSRERRLASLSRRVLEVQELERRAIARELHDEIGQSLTAIKLMLQRHRQADECQETKPIDELLEVADRTLQQVRGLSLDLRPSMLDHLGLPATLRWYVDRESERSGLEATLEVQPEDLRLDPQRETALFRIAQEALTNVSKHAGATHVALALTSNGKVTELSIRDNGRGFDVADARRRGRLGESTGLLGMEERAVLAGGSLKIQSGPSGTEIRAAFSEATP
jgi:signal transduction histidine kinase